MSDQVIQVKRYSSGMVELLEGSTVLAFWAAPKHRPERATKHESIANRLADGLRALRVLNQQRQTK